MEKIQFSELPISSEIKNAVAEMGFEEATLIQSQSIPLILEGNDIIGHSQTGTGKTAAFGIPAIERLDRSKKGKTQALILCPTRELAIQACDEMRKFAKYKPGVRVLPIFGGQPIDRQIKALSQGAEIIIGTPGRVMDHMRRKTVRFNHISMVVLDEADEMLNMGFREDIETILNDISEERQTVLFSATMSQEILQITKNYQKDPQLIKVVHQQLTVPSIKQYYYEVPVGRKVDILCRLLDYYNPGRSIVFCNTKKMVDELVNSLQMRGYMAEGLHGDMKQPTRTHVMQSFKSGKIDILIATDVAARGIDVDDMEAVFNYDLPQDIEYYIHRIGRTGRAGKKGRAFSLVCGRRQIQDLKIIENYTKSRISLRDIPTYSEVEEIRVEKNIEQIREALKSKHLKKYESLLDKLIDEDYSSVDISLALMNILFSNEVSTSIIEENNLLDKQIKEKKKKFSKNEEDNYTFSKKTGGKQPGSKKAGKRLSASEVEKLLFSVGKKDKVSANHILGSIVGETNLPAKYIGNIDIRDHYTIVETPRDQAEQILSIMKGKRIKGIKVKCGYMDKMLKKIDL